MSLWREPLLHFTVLGGLVFAAHAAWAPDPEPERRIVVTPELREALVRQHRLRTGADPDEGAVQAAVEAWVDREVLYREAVALGLDRGDPVVRRRLVQKLEFLAEDAPTETPDDAALTRHLATHAGEFAEPPRLTLAHVFLRRARAGEADEVLGSLRGGADPAGLGDPFVHGREVKRRTAKQLGGLFGKAFAAAVSELPVGEDWRGPVGSTYGVHLVRVLERTPGRVPPLKAVRAKVVAHLDAQRRAAARVALVARLRAHYEVVGP